MYDRIKTYPLKYTQRRKIITDVFFYLIWTLFALDLLFEYMAVYILRNHSIFQSDIDDANTILKILYVATLIYVIIFILFRISRRKYSTLYIKDEYGDIWKIRGIGYIPGVKKKGMTYSKSIAENKELSYRLVTDRDFYSALTLRVKRYKDVNLVKNKRRYIVLSGKVENRNGDDKEKRFKVYKYFEGYDEFVDSIVPIDL